MTRQFHMDATFLVYGNFDADDVQAVIADASPGAWCEVDAYFDPEAVAAQQWPLNEPPFCNLLLEADEAAVHSALAAPAAILVVAQLPAPDDPLDAYLGVAQLVSLLAVDATAVVDLRAGMIVSGEAWSQQIGIPLAGNEFDIRDHIQQKAIETEDGVYWLSTRGMIKFGKPELSIHGLSLDELDDCCTLLNSLAFSIVTGNDVPGDGDTVVQVPGVIEYIAQHGGDYENDDFWRNVHVELVRKSQD